MRDTRRRKKMTKVKFEGSDTRRQFRHLLQWLWVLKSVPFLFWTTNAWILYCHRPLFARSSPFPAISQYWSAQRYCCFVQMFILSFGRQVGQYCCRKWTSRVSTMTSIHNFVILSKLGARTLLFQVQCAMKCRAIERLWWGWLWDDDDDVDQVLFVRSGWYGPQAVRLCSFLSKWLLHRRVMAPKMCWVEDFVANVILASCRQTKSIKANDRLVSLL